MPREVGGGQRGEGDLVVAGAPEARRAIIVRTWSAGRSRTGRVIMPAWQKRQPRVQPRKTSTLSRSCTTSVSGTSWCFG